jgi:hypothetical protein
MERVMRELADRAPEMPGPTADDLPVEAMHWTLADHYAEDERLPLGDARQFDQDLRRLFATANAAPAGDPAARFLMLHEGELVSRISYWAGVGPSAVRSLITALAGRAESLGLRVAGLEATTLIEVTAFGMAVVMQWRYTHVIRATRDEVKR